MRLRTKVLLVLSPFIFWYVATPRVAVYFADNGKGELSYIWNVEDRIDKGHISPGGATADTGFIFPGDEFFMEFSWQPYGGRSHCVSIIPNWPKTSIYLDLHGNLDTEKGVGTDANRLKQCEWDRAKP